MACIMHGLTTKALGVGVGPLLSLLSFEIFIKFLDSQYPVVVCFCCNQFIFVYWELQIWSFITILTCYALSQRYSVIPMDSYWPKIMHNSLILQITYCQAVSSKFSSYLGQFSILGTCWFSCRSLHEFHIYCILFSLAHVSFFYHFLHWMFLIFWACSLDKLESATMMITAPQYKFIFQRIRYGVFVWGLLHNTDLLL